MATQRNRGARPRLSLAVFRRLWADPGLSRNDIAARVGVHPASVSRIGREMGMPSRRPMRDAVRAPYDLALLAAMWRAGVEQSHMADFFGVSDTTIRNRARRQGLLPRSGFDRIPPAERLTVEAFMLRRLAKTDRAARVARDQAARGELSEVAA